MSRSPKRALRSEILPVSSSAKRAALYLRVSTGRQAEGQVSLPSQRELAMRYCADRGWPVVAEFVDAGLSGRDDHRPQLRAMLDAAQAADRPFDLIVVHAFSRFFRDSVSMELTIRRLRKVGVEIVSITQPSGPDPSQQMVRQIIGLFDEYTSHENGKNVSRAMAENARQGFHNGTTPPLGYVAVEAERRGAKIKRRLAIHPVEAETVRLIFQLYVLGDHQTGTAPLGIKEIAKWLNERGHRTKRGGAFGVGPTHTILTNPIYIGEGRYNLRDSRSGTRRPDHEVITYQVPPIIDRDLFEKVQAKRAAHHPRVTAPRVASPAMLLTGIAVCAECGAGMTQRTGTSRSGRIYHYYCCAGRAQKGPSACRGTSVRMSALDSAVLSTLRDQLLQPDRLAAVLSGILDRRAARISAIDTRLFALQREAQEAEDKLARLYRLVEDGTVGVDDILKQRLEALKSVRTKARAALDHARSLAGAVTSVDADKIARFASAMGQFLADESNPALKAYLRTIVGQVVVGVEKIRIIGSKEMIAAAIAGQNTNVPGVRSFVPKWRARKDSNL